MRAHNPLESIVLNEFQWMHHTYVIAVMISSSVGICERGDGHAPGGRGRQRACTSGAEAVGNGNGDELDGDAFGGTGTPFVGVCDSLTGSFESDMGKERRKVGDLGPEN